MQSSLVSVRTLVDLSLEKFWWTVTRLANQQSTVVNRLTDSSDFSSSAPLDASLLAHELNAFCCALRERYGKLPSTYGDLLLRRIANSLTLNDDIAYALFDDANGLFNLQRVIIRQGALTSDRLVQMLVSRRLHSLECNALQCASLSSALVISAQTLTDLHLSYKEYTGGTLLDHTVFSQLKQLRSLRILFCRAFTDVHLQAVCESGAPLRSIRLCRVQVRSTAALLAVRDTLVNFAFQGHEWSSEQCGVLQSLSKLRNLDLSCPYYGGKENPQVNWLLNVTSDSKEAVDEAQLWPQMKAMNVSGWKLTSLEDSERLAHFVASHKFLEALYMAACSLESRGLRLRLHELMERHPQLLLYQNTDLSQLVAAIETVAKEKPSPKRTLRMLCVLHSTFDVKGPLTPLDPSMSRVFVALASIADHYFDNTKIFRMAVRCASAIGRAARRNRDETVNRSVTRLAQLCVERFESVGIFTVHSAGFESLLLDAAYLHFLCFVDFSIDLTTVIAPMRLLRLYITAVAYAYHPDYHRSARSKLAISLLDFLIPRLVNDDPSRIIKLPSSQQVVQQIIDCMICAIRAFGFEPIAADGMHYRTFMLELAANALWNVTDENPLASKYFARVALHTYIQLLDLCETECAAPDVSNDSKLQIRAYRNQFRLLACLNNVMEVAELRNLIRGDSLKVMCKCMHVYDEPRTVYFACGIVANVLVSMRGVASDADQFNDAHQQLLRTVALLEEQDWLVSPFVNYVSFKPFFRLIESSVDGAVYFGCAVLYFMMRMETTRDRYVRLFSEENGRTILLANVLENEHALAQAKRLSNCIVELL